MGLWKAENSGGSSMYISGYSVYTVKEEESQSGGGAWKEITLSKVTHPQCPASSSQPTFCFLPLPIMPSNYDSINDKSSDWVTEESLGPPAEISQRRHSINRCFYFRQKYHMGSWQSSDSSNTVYRWDISKKWYSWNVTFLCCKILVYLIQSYRIWLWHTLFWLKLWCILGND